MNKIAQRLDKILRRACASLLTVAAGLFSFILVGLSLHDAYHHRSGESELVFFEVLAIITALAFFSGFASWRLWRGSLSSNGATLMPTWFIQAFGGFLLVGIVYIGYSNPSWWIAVVGAIVALGVISFPGSLAENE